MITIKHKLVIILSTVIFHFGCNNKNDVGSFSVNNNHENNEAALPTPTTKDSLIAELANMTTDTLDCNAETYWKIIGKGKPYIPLLIESLTDTTPTNIYHGCKKGNLNIGELSYFALEEIADFPAFVVTQIQFDVISIEDGWSCWSFYDYLFNDQNKKEYQTKVKSFYEKSEFEFVEYPDSLITECMKAYSIKGKLEWKQ